LPVSKSDFTEMFSESMKILLNAALLFKGYKIIFFTCGVIIIYVCLSSDVIFFPSTAV